MAGKKGNARRGPKRPAKPPAPMPKVFKLSNMYVNTYTKLNSGGTVSNMGKKTPNNSLLETTATFLTSSLLSSPWNRKTDTATSATRPSGENSTCQKITKAKCGMSTAKSNNNNACTPKVPKTAAWSSNAAVSTLPVSDIPRARLQLQHWDRRSLSSMSRGIPLVSVVNNKRSNCQSYHVRKSRTPTNIPLATAAVKPDKSDKKLIPKSAAMAAGKEDTGTAVLTRNHTEPPETTTAITATRPKRTWAAVMDMIHSEEPYMPT
mmetsp:Transcript_41509/g.133991  ORF Transcript_41509/g.133991 Transcript_41509/m.133991 type:complete len:263 (+) Transcript_41509:299-1087(+)